MLRMMLRTSSATKTPAMTALFRMLRLLRTCGGDGGVRTCGQCGAEDQDRFLKPHADPLTGEPVWLHKACERFWQRANVERVNNAHEAMHGER